MGTWPGSESHQPCLTRVLAGEDHTLASTPSPGCPSPRAACFPAGTRLLAHASPVSSQTEPSIMLPGSGAPTVDQASCLVSHPASDLYGFFKTLTALTFCVPGASW